MYTALLAVLVVISAYLAGMFHAEFKKGTLVATEDARYKCCDTGDKADCHARDNISFQFTNYHQGGKTDTYALLKSDVYMINYGNRGLFQEHMDPAEGRNNDQFVYASGHVDGSRVQERVFINPSETLDKKVFPECIPDIWGRKNTGYDRLYGRPDPLNRNVAPYENSGCYGVNDDLLLYLCRKDSVGDCDISLYAGDDPKKKKLNPLVHSQELRFDVYIRTSRGEGIPATLSDCEKPAQPAGSENKIAFRPSPGGQPNLQLRTFKFVSGPAETLWLSPFCKPAIYLYPERKSEINVSVFPEGKMLLTIPSYPKTGWNVVADPDGTIHYGSEQYDYLYYEASLPDQRITQPEKGYVMPYDQRALFLTELVTKLGLNQKETKQFIDYWVPILPKSPYYFVGIVSQEKLHELSPLFITPQPKHLIRVTLYFKPLEEKIAISPPLILPVSRDGYTAVEWGGIFKQDKAHPFTCFM